MKLKTAKRVQDWVKRDAPWCRVTALVEDPETGRYALAVLDTTTSEQFTVATPEAWTERMDQVDA